MKTLAIVCLPLVFLASIACPQKPKGGLETPIVIAKPDFSGRWQFNPSKSRIDKNVEPGIADGLWHLVVDHKEPTVSVLVVNPTDSAPSKKSSMLDFAWFTDGRGNGWDPTFEFAFTTTRWTDIKLITNHYQDEFKTAVMQSEEIGLEADGKTLRVIVKTYIFRGPGRSTKDIVYVETSHLVFDRIK